MSRSKKRGKGSIEGVDLVFIRTRKEDDGLWVSLDDLVVFINSLPTPGYNPEGINPLPDHPHDPADEWKAG